MSWSIVLAIPLVGYLAVLGFFHLFQERLVFYPHRGGDSTPQEWGMAAQELILQSGGYRIHGWYMPGHPRQPVVLFSHGNASTVANLREYALLFRQMDLGVLLYDYRGYGRSEGQPDEEGVYADGEAAWRHLTGGLGVDPRRVVLYGHSLGGGVATWLASRHPGLALVVEGTFTSLPDLGKEVYPFLPRWLARISFDNRARMAALAMPVMIIHGLRDEVVPPTHARDLFAAAGEPKILLEIDATHNHGLVDAGEGAWNALHHFIQTAQRAQIKE